jgi:hypothetical protein
MYHDKRDTLSERIANALPIEAAHDNPFEVGAPPPGFNPFNENVIEGADSDADEGSYEYQLIAAHPPLAADEIESAASAVEVRLLWGRNLLHVAHLDADKSFYAGELEDEEKQRKDMRCDYFIPASKLGASRAPLVLEGSAVLLPNATTTVQRAGKPTLSLAEAMDAGLTSPCGEVAGAQLLPLSKGMKVSMQLDDMTVELTGVRRAKKVATVFTFAALLGGAALYVLASFIGHTGLLFTMAALAPPLNGTTDDSMTDEQLQLMLHYLDAVDAETERQESQTEQLSDRNPDEKEGGRGTRAKNEEGKMGDATSSNTNGRWGAQGPADNPDPHLARVAALRDAQSFGMIGLINTGDGGDPDAPTVDWGRDTSSGIDALSARGNMWGDSLANAQGAGGLGLSGIGEGGGGYGEGIGLGNFGDLGHGAGRGTGQGFGDGFGGSTGRLQRRHKVKAPSVRIGQQTVSGRLPPEVIQRIVRQNYGRFRLCYQDGLRNQPSLQGRVSVSFVIGRDGRVSNVGGSGDIPDQGVVSCVTRAFYGLSFPQPEGGIVTVRYPILFSPSS